MNRVGISKIDMRLGGLLLLLALVFSASTVQPVLSQQPSDPIRVESDDGRVGQSGEWTNQSSQNVSGGGYLYSSGSTDDVLTFNFYGSTIDIVYVGHPSFGSFAIDIDNDIRRTVVTTSEETTFDNRAVVDYLDEEFHTLRLYAVEGVIGIDAFITQLAPIERTEAGTIWYVATYGSDTNTCLVLSGPCKTIQAAIDKASTGDIIQIRFGTYNEAFVITKNLTINGPSSTYYTTSIDGTDLTSSIVTVNAGVTATINDVIIENGTSGTEIDGLRVGGGVYNQGNLTLNRVTVSDNRVRGDDGNGILGGSYSPAGGGIYNANSGTLTLIDSTISNNESVGGDGADADLGGGGGGGLGGGIFNNAGSVMLENSTVENNRAIGGNGGGNITGWAGGGGGGGVGAGIFDNGGTLIINDSTISSNQAQGGNGGPGGGTDTLTVGGGGGNGGDGLFEPIGGEGTFGGGGGGAYRPLEMDTHGGNSLFAGGGGGGYTFHPLGLPPDQIQSGGTSYFGGGGDGGDGSYGLAGGGFGAGIYAESGSQVTIMHSTVSANEASAGAEGYEETGGGSTCGGICAGGTLTIEDSEITSNIAWGQTSEPYNYGAVGAIYVGDTATIRNSVISHNKAGLFGGGIVNSGTTIIDQSVISDNSTGDRSIPNGQSYGAGIVNHTQSNLIITNSLVANNEAIGGEGAGLYSTGTMEIANTTISGNRADHNGGGIRTRGSTIYLNNTTIAYNIADVNEDGLGWGGGISQEFGITYLKNSIIANNINTIPGSPDCHFQYDSTQYIITSGYNLIGDNTGCETVFPAGLPNGNNDFVGTNASPLDPLIADLTIDGSASAHGLYPDSLALDAIPPANCTYLSSGDNPIYQNGDPVTTDQRGNSRPVGTNCDIGAVEQIEATCDFNEIMQIASKASDGTIGNSDSFNVELSADGRFVTFDSDATNLVANDANNATDVFVHDRLTCETSRVSISSAGGQGDMGSRRPDISDDGRYVVFESDATNLIDNDTNHFTDIYLHDLLTGQTSRVSVSTAGDQVNGHSFYPVISGDGDTISYQSEARNLVPNDTNGGTDIFWFNRLTQETARISESPSGESANLSSGNAAISADGQVVVFYSYASNLISDDTNDSPDIFVYDRSTDEISRVNVSTAGAEANDWSLHPVISADGNVVTFMSRATNLVPSDTNDAEDIFMHNRSTGVTSRVSVDSSGRQSNGHADYPDISGDGRYVVYYSEATNLVANDTNSTFDGFWHDTQTGETTRLSVSVASSQGNNPSRYPTISADGVYAAFESDASNLVAGDGNGKRDIFVRTLLSIDAPFALTATPISRTQIDLSWSDSTGENPTFHIERSPNGTDNWVEIGTSTTTTFSDSDLTCGTPYYYRVYAMIGAVQSGLSNVATAITNVCPPTLPVLIAPLGSITNPSPTFEWNEAENTAWYRLYVRRGLTVLHDAWYDKGNFIMICDGLVCSVTPSLPLTNGNYSWYVDGWGPSIGFTHWSDEGIFSVNLPAPDPINKITPTDTSTLTNGEVTFTWDHDPNATWYQFWLSGTSTWYKAASICTTTCSVDRSLHNGGYIWYVQAYGPGGYGSWGSGFTFTVAIPKPAIITRIAPIGSISTSTPDFVWQHDPNAAWYQVWIGNIDSTIHTAWYQASTICSDGTCTLPAPNTYIGQFQWYVRGWSIGGYGDWGTSTNFSYTLALNAPTGTVNGTNITYQWNNAGSSTTWYQIWVGIDGGGGIFSQWIDATTTCNGSTCSFTKTISMSAGNYIWYLQPYGTYGYGPWSVGQTIAVPSP